MSARVAGSRSVVVTIDFEHLVKVAVENERNWLLHEIIKGVEAIRGTQSDRLSYREEPRPGTQVKADVLAVLDRVEREARERG